MVAQAEAGRGRLGLLAQPDFRRLWLAQSVSWLGSGVGSVAGPLVAVGWLGASAWQMGLLGAASQLPALLLSLFIGVWVDRLPRRPVLIWTDLGRGALRLAIPLLALGGILSIEWLYLIAFLVGVLGVTFDIASTTYAPSLVRRDELVEANAKLTLSRSVAQVTGPAAAGPLVQAVGAPLVVGLDALSYFASALLTARIAAPEPPKPTRPKPNVRQEIAEGWRALWDEPLVRDIVLATAVAALGGAVINTVYVLYVTRELGLSPTELGLVFGCYGVAAVVGGSLAGRIAQRLGIGPTLVCGQLLIVGGAGLALVAGPAPVAVLAAGQVTAGFGMTVVSITQISMRQALTPSHILGRVNATRRVMVFGVQPIGALAGGFVGEALGLQAAIAAGIVIELVATAMLWPLRRVRTFDA
jgi:MFS family permease